MTGVFKKFYEQNLGKKRVLKGVFADATGSIEITWFNHYNWVKDKIKQTFNMYYLAELVIIKITTLHIQKLKLRKFQSI